MSEAIKTVFVVGPTASGKTTLGIQLAKAWNGEIISADSMQIYRGLHIASAAPDREEMQGIPHHLIEFLDMKDAFSVADYVKLARACLIETAQRGRLPIVVGGTGLYINALAGHIEFLEEETDPALRRELEIRMEQIGAEAMLRELAVFDPEAAAALHPNNKRRIIRAFEIYRQTGRTVTEQNRLSRQSPSPLAPCMIGITYRNRALLYERINRRVDRMLASGLLEEAAAAYADAEGRGGYQAIGHKELYRYLEGACRLEEAAELLKRQTRRYAKRQLTWFGRDERIHWLYADETDDLFGAAADIIQPWLAKEEDL